MRTLLVLSSVLVLAACAGFPQNQAPAVPQRPLLSTNTDTTALNTAEAEAGAMVDPDDYFRLPTTIKYGAGDHTEVFAATSLWTHIDANSADGPEDLRLGVRHRLLDETPERPSVAFQITNQLPTGDRINGLGAGGTEFFAAVMATKTFDDNRLTGFYQLGLLDDPNGGNPDFEHDLAIAATHRFDAQWSAFGELAGVLISERDIEAGFATIGAAYAVNRFLVLDAGFVVGLSPDSPDFQLVFGGTWNMGRLFGN